MREPRVPSRNGLETDDLQPRVGGKAFGDRAVEGPGPFEQRHQEPQPQRLSLGHDALGELSRVFHRAHCDQPEACAVFGRGPCGRQALLRRGIGNQRVHQVPGGGFDHQSVRFAVCIAVDASSGRARRAFEHREHRFIHHAGVEVHPVADGGAVSGGAQPRRVRHRTVRPVRLVPAKCLQPGARLQFGAAAAIAASKSFRLRTPLRSSCCRVSHPGRSGCGCRRTPDAGIFRRRRGSRDPAGFLVFPGR